MANPFLSRISRGGSGRSGVASEKKAAKRLGARQTRYSGAMATERGDMELAQFKIEAKSSTKDSISIKLDWLAKISQEAQQEGLTPALSVSFVHGSGEPRAFGTWVAVPEDVFRKLIGAE